MHIDKKQALPSDMILNFLLTAGNLADKSRSCMVQLRDIGVVSFCILKYRGSYEAVAFSTQNICIFNFLV